MKNQTKTLLANIARFAMSCVSAGMFSFMLCWTTIESLKANGIAQAIVAIICSLVIVSPFAFFTGYFLSDDAKAECEFR